MENSTDYMYNSLASPQKDKNILTVYFINSTLGHTHQWTENSCSNNNWYTNIHSNIIHNSPKVQLIQLSISGWMNMENRVYAKASTIFYHTKNTVKMYSHCPRGFFFFCLKFINKLTICQFQIRLCTQKFWKNRLKKINIFLHSYSQQH